MLRRDRLVGGMAAGGRAANSPMQRKLAWRRNRVAPGALPGLAGGGTNPGLPPDGSFST
jgi:hypothetical protein